MYNRILAHKKFGFILFLLVGSLLVWGFYSIGQLILIKNKGTRITATVIKVHADCHRHNQIEVVFEDKAYPVNISRSDCRNRIYKEGQKVTLIKYKDFNTLVWPDAQYNWLPFLFITLFALVYYTNKRKFSKSEKPKPMK